MKAQMLLIMSLMTIPEPRNSVCRSVQRNARNTGWWQLVWNTYNDKRFKETFRVTRATFLCILEHIRPKLEKEQSPKNPFPPSFS